MAVLSSTTVVLPMSNIDTDQIIPARFLTTTRRDGLGRYLFAGWRYDDDGKPRADFPLNQPGAGGSVLVAGDNFGCGSSREHAPWALLDYGFRAVISTGIADIFKSNALKNGLIPIVVDGAVHTWLVRNPGVEVGIDVDTRVIRLPDGRAASFPLDEFARYCLMHGVDELGYLLQQEETIRHYELENGK